MRSLGRILVSAVSSGRKKGGSTVESAYLSEVHQVLEAGIEVTVLLQRPDVLEDGMLQCHSLC